MQERQHTLGAVPIKMKMAHSGEPDSRWATLRKYNFYGPRKEEEKQLSSSHVLEAKTIPHYNAPKPAEEQPTREKTTILKHESRDNSKAIQVIPNSRHSLQRSIHNLLTSYVPDNVASYTSGGPSHSTGNRFGRAELVDYTEVCPSSDF